MFTSTHDVKTLRSVALSCQYADGHLFIFEDNGAIHILRDYKRALREHIQGPRFLDRLKKFWFCIYAECCQFVLSSYASAEGPWICALWLAEEEELLGIRSHTKV